MSLETIEREVRLTTVRYEAVMLKMSVAFVFATSLLGLPGRITIHAASVDQAPAAEQDFSDEESVRLLAQGKEIFLERCARCHNESGDKPLKTGAPLNERGLSTDVIAQAVNGRLRDRTEAGTTGSATTLRVRVRLPEIGLIA